MLYATPYITAYVLVVTALLGLVMGSFLNCWAWRITHGESVWKGRSHCTDCGHVLGAKDLVPIASWLASHRACRYCGAPISWRYPATELLCTVVYVSIVVRYGLTLEAAQMLCFASVLLVLSLTDLDDYLIPNGCIIAAIVIRALYILLAGLLEGADVAALAAESALGGVVILIPLVIIVLITDKVLGRPSMGGGDLKLFFVAGLYFGWQQCLLLIIVSCVLGIIAAYLGPKPHDAALNEAGDEDSPQDGTHRVIPFGPAIAAGCWFIMLFGAQLVSSYLGLF